jgi:RNA polymerase sigma-70 factor (ECF subfamily)
LQKLSDYKSKNILSYLITIAKNLAINEYNRRKKVTKLDDLNEFSYEEYIEIKLERQEIISNALSILDDDEKNVFLLHVIENLTHREISIITSKPTGTVSWLYSKAVKKMKDYLKEENYEF